MTATKRIAFGLTLAVFAASWIAPRWPVEQALHSSLTVLGLAWLWWHDRRWPLRPLHFALVMLVNLNIGLITPPVGVCLFAAAPIAGISIERLSKAVLPFIGAELFALLLLTYIPELVLIVPRLMGFIH